MARPGRVLIGAGRMGAALAAGWLQDRARARPVLVDPAPSKIARDWAEAGRVQLNPTPQAAASVVIAVKPQAFVEAADGIRAWIGPKTLVISIMAGVTLAALARALGTAQVVRAMPNTPGAIGRGVTLLAAGEGTGHSDIAQAVRLLSPLGKVEGPIPEPQLSAATGLSGSGPAYVFLLTEVLAAAGEAEGLPADLAARLARETVIGTAALMDASEDSPEALRRAVTSPGGVTAAALDVLMAEKGMPSLFRKALKAASARDRALAAPDK